MKDNIELIVLNTSPLKDNAIILHCLSNQYGRQALVLKFSKRQNKAGLRPLNILEADIYKNNKSKLWTASNISYKYKLNDIENNISKTAISLFIAEVLFKSLKEGVLEDYLYNWCIKQILTLDKLESNFHNFHILFLLNYCSILGFMPNIQDISPFTKNNEALAEKFLTQSFEECLLIDLSGEQRNTLCEDILKYIEYHTESRINIKSLSILRELFA